MPRLDHDSDVPFTDIDKQTFEQFTDEFKKETDRAAVILAASKLDIQLFQILQKILKPSPTRSDELLEGDSPLGTFSSRVMMCHRLGVIDDEVARAIHIIRKIRNSFAHELTGASLNQGSHKDRVRELSAGFSRYDDYEWFVNTFFKDCPGSSGEFRACVAILSLRLYGTHHRIEPIHFENPMPLLPPHKIKKK